MAKQRKDEGAAHMDRPGGTQRWRPGRTAPRISLENEEAARQDATRVRVLRTLLVLRRNVGLIPKTGGRHDRVWLGNDSCEFVFGADDFIFPGPSALPAYWYIKLIHSIRWYLKTEFIF